MLRIGFTLSGATGRASAALPNLLLDENGLPLLDESANFLTGDI